MLAGLLVALTATAILLLSNDRTGTSAALPSPNGYDDLVKAGTLLPVFEGDYRTLTEAELRERVSQSAAALDLLLAGLDQECQVPIDYSRDYADQHIPALSSLKRLANALAAEGALAELNGETNQAARCYIDNIRLGQELARGGLLIDALLGLACEAIGSVRLEKIVSGLDAQQCRTLAGTMQSIASKRQAASETLRVEREWSRRAYSFFERFPAMIGFGTTANQIYQRYLARLEVELARQRKITLDLATRAYQLENGRPPSSPSELLPGYLSAVPDNPQRDRAAAKTNQMK